MYYEINVAFNGFHLFATAERSITNTIELEKVLNIFRLKFPIEEGYEITVKQYEKIGHFVDI